MTLTDPVAPEAAPERDSPFNQALKVWASWMTLKDRREPSGWSHPQDAKEFMSVGSAVDTLVNDLPRVQFWAIYKSRGIATVWRFPELSFADAMGDAEERLTPKLRANLTTRRFFKD